MNLKKDMAAKIHHSTMGMSIGVWYPGRHQPFILKPRVPRQIITVTIYVALNIRQILFKAFYTHYTSSLNAFNLIKEVLLPSFYNVKKQGT
jgi:hypothetical protein